MRKRVSSLILAGLLVVGLGKAWGGPPDQPIRFAPFPSNREKQRFNCEDGLEIAIFSENGWRMTAEDMKTAGIVDFACVKQDGGQVYIYTIKRAEHLYLYGCREINPNLHLCSTIGFEIIETNGLGLGKASIIFKAR